jgi:steroid delta-isomerase-like uncharacterized protein
MSKEVVREYVARFNRGDADGLRELFHEDAQVHDASGWLELDEVMPLWEQTIDGLGVDLDIERIIAEEEAIALLYTERGWSRSVFQGRPATGRAYEIPAIDWFVIHEGRISRQWRVRDRASQARQLGWDRPLADSIKIAS